MIKTTFKEIDGKYVVTLEGRLDTAVSAQTAQELSVLNDCLSHDIEIDCSELEYISSSGPRTLLGIRKHAVEAESNVTILHINDDIRKVFQMAGFSNIFDIK